MQQEKYAAMEQAIAADYSNIAGMVVRKDGRTAYENYFGGCARESRLHIFSATRVYLKTPNVTGSEEYLR